jgi:ABC-type polysaccharide/polyol phosphate export permease
MRPLVQLVPLYHGVALVRAACFGGALGPVLAHLAVLLALVVGGVLAGSVTLRHRLID